MIRPGRGVADRPPMYLRRPANGSRDIAPIIGLTAAVALSVPVWWGLAWVATWAWGMKP